MIENVTIVGMGALGILYGDLMERTLGPGHVRFIAEGERLTRLQQEGAWCNGRKCDFTVTDNTGEEAELLLFAVKMTALDEAMELAAPLVGEDTVILSLLNGVTSEEHIGQTFGPGKILYCVAQGMDAVREDNRLTYTQAGKLYLGLPEEDYFDRGGEAGRCAGIFAAGRGPRRAGAGGDSPPHLGQVHAERGREPGLHGLRLYLWSGPETRRSERHDDRRHARGEKGGGLPGRFGDAEGPV